MVAALPFDSALLLFKIQKVVVSEYQVLKYKRGQSTGGLRWGFNLMLARSFI